MNAKEISDATLESVIPADNDLMLIYDTSEGTTGKATIAGIAPKVAENINIATLPAVTPAADDVLMIGDTSAGTTGKATIADVISFVGDTSKITESSALANLGISANATQHDINLAINSLHQYDDSSYSEIQGLTPFQGTVSILAKRKSNIVTLKIYLSIDLTGSTHFTTDILPVGSIPAKYRPSLQQVYTTCLGYRNSETTYMQGRFVISSDGKFSLGEYYTIGNEQATTTFDFIITYVV